MTVKKAIALTLISIATIGLVTCAVVLNKKKATQSNAQTQKEELIEDQLIYNNTNNDRTYLNFEINVINTLNTNNTNVTNTLKIDTKLTDIYTQNTLNTTEDVKTTNITITDIPNTIEINLITFRYLGGNPYQQRFNYDYTYNITLLKDTTTLYEINNINNGGYVVTNNPTISNILTPSTYIKTTIDSVINTFTTEEVNIYQQGTIDIYNYAYNTGYNEGETTGYGTGYNDGEQLSNPIDVRGLMLNVLTMPFTFIRQGFNVTMWEGTPYQFNVANFILSLIAIATILFIIRLFTNGFTAIGNYQSTRENKQLRKSKIEVNKARSRRINNLADKGK